MSENGNGKRILSLDAAREGKVRKGNDFITVQQCYDLVIQECAKVHEYYLTQIPGYVANMIADALVDRGLIPEFRTGPEATAEAPVESADAIPASGDTAPSDSIAPTFSENVDNHMTIAEAGQSPDAAPLAPTDPAA